MYSHRHFQANHVTEVPAKSLLCRSHLKAGDKALQWISPILLAHGYDKIVAKHVPGE